MTPPGSAIRSRCTSNQKNWSESTNETKQIDSRVATHKKNPLNCWTVFLHRKITRIVAVGKEPARDRRLPPALAMPWFMRFDVTGCVGTSGRPLTLSYLFCVFRTQFALSNGRIPGSNLHVRQKAPSRGHGSSKSKLQNHFQCIDFVWFIFSAKQKAWCCDVWWAKTTEAGTCLLRIV